MNLSGMYLDCIRTQVSRKELEKLIPGIPANKQLVALLRNQGRPGRFGGIRIDFERRTHALFDRQVCVSSESYSISLNKTKDGTELKIHTYLANQRRHINYSVNLKKLSCFGRQIA